MRARNSNRALMLAGIASALVLSASAAFADPITLPTGGIWAQLSGAEEFAPLNNTGFNATNGSQSVATGGEGNWGVFDITTLGPAGGLVPNAELAPDGTPFFVNGQNGGNQILGMFYGVNITSVGTPTLAQDGVLDLYWWDSNNQNNLTTLTTGGASLRNNISESGAPGSGYAGYTCAPGTPGCTFLAELDFVPGNFNAAYPPNTTVASITDPAVTANNTAYFEAEVDTSAGGAWAPQLANNYFLFNPNSFPPLNPLPDPADLNGQDDTSPCSGVGATLSTCAGWSAAPFSTGLSLSDPEQLFVAEPTSIALFGAGLLGIGLFYRRRQKRSGAKAV